MRWKAHYQSPEILQEQIAVARGLKRAQRVIKGAQFLDVFTGTFVRGDIAVHGGYIVGTCDSYAGDDEETLATEPGLFVVPGFIDAHVHIESSLMTPARFEEAVLPLGTTTAIWDPHEIANVKGKAGIEWALAASKDLRMDVFVMLPSCVPSTSVSSGLESSGAELRSQDLAPFRDHPQVLGLAEMMNYPGLLNADEDIIAKLFLFAGAKRDGHCPGLSGKDLNAYGVAGIHSCHESVSRQEAKEKLHKGIHVLIREGSCAKNADELLPLVDAYSSAVLCLCSDDRNPADIAAEGHIDAIINKGLSAGLSPAALFRCASFAAARAYGLDDRGAIAPGYLADFCIVRQRVVGDWQAGIEVEAVYKGGQRVGTSQAAPSADAAHALRFFGKARNLKLDAANAATFALKAAGQGSSQRLRVIEVLPNQIVTRAGEAVLPLTSQGLVASDPQRDLLKIAVLERHHGSGRRAVGLVRGFGLQQGAIATSINHDSHNVIVVGADDAAMAAAVNQLRAIDGGIVVWQSESKYAELALPLGGLMSHEPPASIQAALQRLKALAAELGCTLHEPFLQLSFLALPVIPELKITDRGLVDVNAFKVVDLAY